VHGPADPLPASERLDEVCRAVRAGGAEARSSWVEAVRSARERSDAKALAHASLCLAVALHQSHDPGAASAALAEGEGDDEPSRLVADLLGLRLLVETGQRSAAFERGRSALARAKALGDRGAEATLLLELGLVHADARDAQRYADVVLQALDLFRALGDRRGITACLGNLGCALTWRGRPDEAERCHDEGLAIAVELGARREQAVHLAGLGRVACQRARFDEGRGWYAESRRILEGLDEPFLIARNHLNLGRMLQEADLLDQALEELSAAQALAEAHGYRAVGCDAWEVSALALEARGDPAGALAALRRHLACREVDAGNVTLGEGRDVELERRIAAARREADSERRRSSELAETNEALRAALVRQQELQDELRRLAETDALTGLCNRRKLREYAEQEIRRGARNGRPFCLLLLDVDHFKRVNDTHGHSTGDEVLIELAGRLDHAVRCVDIAARWGGEEFAVLLVDTDTAGGQIAAERVRSAFDARPFHTSRGELAITASVGLASWDRERDSTSLDQLLSRADRALYAAKQGGRNRVVVAG